MLSIIGAIGSGNNLLPSSYVSSGSGSSSSNGTNQGLDISTTGLQAGDYMLIYSDRVGDGFPAITGGSASGWTLNTLTQISATSQKMRCHHKKLVTADVGTTIRCVVESDLTPVRWVVYRGISRASLIEGVTSSDTSPNITFSAVTRQPGSAFLVAGMAQHDAPSGDWVEPSGWTARIDMSAIGPKMIADFNSRASAPANRGFTGADATASQGAVGFLHELIGIFQ